MSQKIYLNQLDYLQVSDQLSSELVVFFTNNV